MRETYTSKFKTKNDIKNILLENYPQLLAYIPQLYNTSPVILVLTTQSVRLNERN